MRIDISIILFEHVFIPVNANARLLEMFDSKCRASFTLRSNPPKKCKIMPTLKLNVIHKLRLALMTAIIQLEVTSC